MFDVIIQVLYILYQRNIIIKKRLQQFNKVIMITKVHIDGNKLVIIRE